MSVLRTNEETGSFDFNSILSLDGLDAKEVALAFHKPSELWKRRALCVMADEDPEAFIAYQSTHPKGPEATVKRRAYLASFVPTASGEMTFVGLFKNNGAHPLGGKGLGEDPAFLRVVSAIYEASMVDAKQFALKYAQRFRFDLLKSDRLSDLIGRLIVVDPGTRAYMRLAETTQVEILEIKRAACITPPMPPWDEVIMLANEIIGLPRDWAMRLSEWRGVYLMVDQADGARYVGSAYGETNLLGRWSTHVSGEYGVTKELSKRKSQSFQFSILELLAPDAAARDVIWTERKWMNRLDTIENGLNT